MGKWGYRGPKRFGYWTYEELSKSTGVSVAVLQKMKSDGRLGMSALEVSEFVCRKRGWLSPDAVWELQLEAKKQLLTAVAEKMTEGLAEV